MLFGVNTGDKTERFGLQNLVDGMDQSSDTSVHDNDELYLEYILTPFNRDVSDRFVPFPFAL